MAFEYETDFPATDPHCPATFERVFEHADWIDGEHVVQAEQTPTEDGFNVRFHEIEDDLDNLGNTFECVTNMRNSLWHLLEEIKQELNRQRPQLVSTGRLTVPRSAQDVNGQPIPGVARESISGTVTAGGDRFLIASVTPASVTSTANIEMPVSWSIFVDVGSNSERGLEVLNYGDRDASVFYTIYELIVPTD